MKNDITFTMIKPGAVANGHIGPIIATIADSGFHIAAMKYTMLTKSQAEAFYSVHSERPFFGELVEFMTSGPIVAILLQKVNAVEDFRKLIGATDPTKASEGTVRKIFAMSLQSNAIHGSDSNENAAIEADFFFAKTDRFAPSNVVDTAKSFKVCPA